MLNHPVWVKSRRRLGRLIQRLEAVVLARATLAMSHDSDWLVHFSLFGAWPVPT